MNMSSEGGMCGRENKNDCEIEVERQGENLFKILQNDLQCFEQKQKLPSQLQIDKMWNQIIKKTKQM